MEQYAVMNRQKPRFHTSILVLAIVALVCRMPGWVNTFRNWFEFNAPLSLLELLYFLMGVSPYVLLIVYASTFRGREKESVLAPVIFGLIALQKLLTIVFNTGYYFVYSITIWVVLSFVTLIMFALAVADMLTGFAKRVLVVIAPIVALLAVMYSLMGVLEMIEFYTRYEMYSWLATTIASDVASVALHTTLLLVALRSRTMPAMVTGSAKAAAPAITPEKALRILQEKKDMGLITEEEYRAERMEIINRI